MILQKVKTEILRTYLITNEFRIDLEPTGIDKTSLMKIQNI